MNLTVKWKPSEKDKILKLNFEGISELKTGQLYFNVNQLLPLKNRVMTLKFMMDNKITAVYQANIFIGPNKLENVAFNDILYNKIILELDLAIEILNFNISSII